MIFFLNTGPTSNRETEGQAVEQTDRMEEEKGEGDRESVH